MKGTGLAPSRNAPSHNESRRALIFDMDGVLIDSEPLWRRAEIAEFARVGLKLDEADCLKTTGQRIDETVEFWFERAPWRGASCREVAEAIVARVIELIEREGEPMPGVVEAIDWSRREGWRLGLASSSPRRLIDCVLTRLKIGRAIEVAHSAEHEIAGKPHPAVYLSTANALGIDPIACVAVEDSVNGVLSALAAGMRCIAIPPAETKDDPRFAQATICLKSLLELPDALNSLPDV